MDMRGRDRGFILAMLLAVITAMGILLTIALPNIKAQVQREEEAELVFRGEAIAGAIRTYKARTGGYPLSLADLGKLTPRIIRRIYTDPMTPDGEWALITAVQPGASGDTTGLPIVGVRSKCMKDSFRIYKGKSLISDWTFSGGDNLLGMPAGTSLPPGAADAASLLGVQVPGANGGAAKPAATPGVIPSAIGGGNNPVYNTPPPAPPVQPPPQVPPAEPEPPAPTDPAPPANPVPPPAEPAPAPPARPAPNP